MAPKINAFGRFCPPNSGAWPVQQPGGLRVGLCHGLELVPVAARRQTAAISHANWRQRCRDAATPLNTPAPAPPPALLTSPRPRTCALGWTAPSAWRRLPAQIRGNSGGNCSSGRSSHSPATPRWRPALASGTGVSPVCPVRTGGTPVPLTPTQYTSTSTAACSADFTTSSNWRGWVDGSLSLAETSGTDSRKLRRKLLFTA